MQNKKRISIPGGRRRPQINSSRCLNVWSRMAKLQLKEFSSLQFGILGMTSHKANMYSFCLHPYECINSTYIMHYALCIMQYTLCTMHSLCINVCNYVSNSSIILVVFFHWEWHPTRLNVHLGLDASIWVHTLSLMHHASCIMQLNYRIMHK